MLWRFFAVLLPREALVWKFDKQDTAKFIFSDSVQRPEEEGMYEQWLATRTASAPAKIRSLELRFERQQTQNLFMGLSFFYNRLNVLGFDSASSENDVVGSYKTAGVEFETTYRTQDDTVTASYGYTKLISQDLTAASGTEITACSTAMDMT